MNDNKEEWKQIPDWEEYYISSKGRVYSTKTNKFLVGDINNAGYLRFSCYKGEKKKRFFRHRLVAELFLENPNNLLEVNHINGDKNNNSVDNLEWIDRVGNEREARRIGLKEYKPFEVIFLDGSKKQYEFKIDLAEELGVTSCCIKNYLHGLSKGYLNKGIKEIYYI